MKIKAIPSYPDSTTFKSNAKLALADASLRQSLRTAMDFLMQKRSSSFPDEDELQTLRLLSEQIRQHALSKLPELLTQLEQTLIKNGIQVHWAQTPEEACQIIQRIIQKHDGKLMVKGKSMVSEEIELNHYLQKHDIKALETDMGEYIVQMAGEKPTHIVMPAIHKTKAQVGELFNTNIDDAPYTEDVDELVQMGRKALRDEYIHADIGMSGVNFAVAETGTLCLVENEGNGRMCTSIPPVHIAITGIEKVVANFTDIVPLYSILTRSAIGQNVTTYFNLISSPRQLGEKDGAKELHLVLLDNGRSQAYADLQLRKTLQCIRCGACMNHCPVYSRIGGAAYGTTYPGPIGEIISPHLLGLEMTHNLPTASSLCGACGEVCPVRIPIPEMLIRLREESQRDKNESMPHSLKGQGAAKNFSENMAWRAFQGVFSGKKSYRYFSLAVTKFRKLTPTHQLGWTQNHIPMKPAEKTLHQLLKERSKTK